MQIRGISLRAGSSTLGERVLPTYGATVSFTRATPKGRCCPVPFRAISPADRLRRLPDRLGIGADGSVGREPAHAGDIRDAGLGPGLLLPVQCVDAPLRAEIVFEIGRYQVVVGISERLG